MRRLSIGATVATVLLALASPMGPTVTFAQGAQHNETDLEFAQRMTQRLERVEKQAEKLQELAARQEGHLTANSKSTVGITTEPDYRTTGSQGRMIDATGGDSYQRNKLKLRSMQRKAAKERKELAAVQGSRSRPEDLDRDAIERDVARMERDLAELDKQIRGGR